MKQFTMLIYLTVILAIHPLLAQNTTNAYGLKMKMPTGWKVVDNSAKSWSFISARHPVQSATIYVESCSANDDRLANKIVSFFEKQAKLAGVSQVKINQNDFIKNNKTKLRKPEKGLSFIVFEVYGDTVNTAGEKGWTLCYVTFSGDKAVFFAGIERFKGTATSTNTIRTALNSISQ
jgi:hypothetical protein